MKRIDEITGASIVCVHSFDDPKALAQPRATAGRATARVRGWLGPSLRKRAREAGRSRRHLLASPTSDRLQVDLLERVGVELRA